MSTRRCCRRILTFAPEQRAPELRSFLEGLPQRYLQTRMPEQIHDHFQMALSSPMACPNQPAQRAPALGPTAITKDRPLLFADMAGALSSWGMNIVKAEAFSDDAGIIVDTFQFSDPFRTLELNPSEVDCSAGACSTSSRSRPDRSAFAPPSSRPRTDHGEGGNPA